ncbi:MAG: DUF3592 domain-containing protein [Planctomycetes bacterium]|nr:DUF3592 domain-containing protein [Planctomycetota bacterium]
MDATPSGQPLSHPLLVLQRLPLVELVLAMMFTLATAGFYGYEWWFMRRARIVEGVVVEMVVTGRMHDMKAPVVEYEVGGIRRRLQIPHASNPPSFALGQKLRVAYDPADPANALSDLEARPLMLRIPAAAAGFCWLLTGYRLLRLRLGRRA